VILSIIVAYAEDNQSRFVIGKDNAIPWHDSKDLARFREHTTGHAVVMGRKTFDSIGKPLRGRENVIITRQKNYKVDGAHVFNDLQEALDFVGPKHSEVFIIGGQELYEQSIERADRLYITHIYRHNIKGDTFFPKWDRVLFKTIQQEDKNERIEFEILQRIKKAEGLETLDYLGNPEGIPYYCFGGAGI